MEGSTVADHAELTGPEQRIAVELGNIMDMAARLITGPVSRGHFLEKFGNLARSTNALADELELDSLGRATDATPKWDPDRVWAEVVQKYSAPGHRLDQVWAALEHENKHYQAERIVGRD